MREETSKRSFVWKYIPPGAPFMDGAWERLVSKLLTHVSVQIEDNEALTPNHFLVGGSGRVQIPRSFTDTDLDSRQHWRCAQRFADQFRDK
ncbi:hypothetical protein EVAR_50411_1 [Eumeta japonica]|uniref:Uncharacterized protein n=1 Tax=Eumeta variegata TaxID=151549 RepID=A0A4C1WXX9_EUMVA|nr:hypothetical protein EVAR_50411_1 [Eumeta japonica]